MNSYIIMPAIAVICMAIASCKSKTQKDAENHMDKIEKTMKENSPANTDANNTEKTALAGDMEDIAGEWEMIGSVVDTNDNLLIDEDERKNLRSAAFKDYMKLNRDGSGLFTAAEMEGRYEITDKENNGKKYLSWYDKANGRHRVGTILSVTKNELQIKEPGGSGLFLWKRL